MSSISKQWHSIVTPFVLHLECLNQQVEHAEVVQRQGERQAPAKQDKKHKQIVSETRHCARGSQKKKENSSAERIGGHARV